MYVSVWIFVIIELVVFQCWYYSNVDPNWNLGRMIIMFTSLYYCIIVYSTSLGMHYCFFWYIAKSNGYKDTILCLVDVAACLTLLWIYHRSKYGCWILHTSWRTIHSFHIVQISPPIWWNQGSYTSFYQLMLYHCSIHFGLINWKDKCIYINIL